VALELDGPPHFLKSPNSDAELEEENLKMDGPTMAKIRMLESLGWQVLSFSWLSRIKVDKMPECERRTFWLKKLGEYRVEPSV